MKRTEYECDRCGEKGEEKMSGFGLWNCGYGEQGLGGKLNAYLMGTSYEHLCDDCRVEIRTAIEEITAVKVTKEKP